MRFIVNTAGYCFEHYVTVGTKGERSENYRLSRVPVSKTPLLQYAAGLPQAISVITCFTEPWLLTTKPPRFHAATAPPEYYLV